MQIIRPTILTLLLLFSVPMVSLAESQGEPPFKPIWQLLNRQEKQQFISGYLFGMRDAATMTEVLQEFVRDNPAAAGESLDKLRSIYLNLAAGKPDTLTTDIDTFFSAPANKDAPLSRAITSANRN